MPIEHVPFVSLQHATFLLKFGRRARLRSLFKSSASALFPLHAFISVACSVFRRVDTVHGFLQQLPCFRCQFASALVACLRASWPRRRACLPKPTVSASPVFPTCNVAKFPCLSAISAFCIAAVACQSVALLVFLRCGRRNSISAEFLPSLLTGRSTYVSASNSCRAAASCSSAAFPRHFRAVVMPLYVPDVVHVLVSLSNYAMQKFFCKIKIMRCAAGGCSRYGNSPARGASFCILACCIPLSAEYPCCRSGASGRNGCCTFPSPLVASRNCRRCSVSGSWFSFPIA